MKEILDMEVSVINRISIEAAVTTQQLPRSKIKEEILVHFHSSEERDVVYAHAKNLARHEGKAGIRLEIPQHLKHEFKLLEGHGNMIRTMYSNGVKRSIRFDDSEYSLVLNVRLAADDPWVSVSVAQAKETKRLRSQASVFLIRHSYGNLSNLAISASQSRALGIPSQPTGGTRPRPLSSPVAAASSDSHCGQPPAGTPNPFSYLNSQDL